MSTSATGRSPASPRCSPRRTSPRSCVTARSGTDLHSEQSLDDLLGEAVGYLHTRAGRDEPFLLYFPLTAPHKPVLPARRFVGATALGPYGDFIVQVDWTVGQVLTTLEGLGLAENTLVLYTSDNGSYMYRQEDADSRRPRLRPAGPGLPARPPHRQRPLAGHQGRHLGGRPPGAVLRALARRRLSGKPSRTPRSCLTDVFATLAEIVGRFAARRAPPRTASACCPSCAESRTASTAPRWSTTR